MDTSTDAFNLLRTYLQDHRAGADAGVATARRAAKNNAGTALGAGLASLADEIVEDRATLEQVMHSLGVSANPVKDVVATVATVMGGALKQNGRVWTYSPLSRIVELEMLLAGIVAKRVMWVALEAVIGSDPKSAGVHFPNLIARAISQQETVEKYRLDAVRTAFKELSLPQP